MRSAFITAAFVSLAIGPVLAQYAPSTPSTTADTPPSARTLPATPPSANAPSNPAVKTTQGNNPGAPVPGANSFTEGQAKSRIEADGFSNVAGLIKAPNGIWRGMAMKDGKQVQVALDFQGNVVIE